MSRYFDKDGEPLELLDWARKFEDDEYRRVMLTEEGDIKISTVWEGIPEAAQFLVAGITPPLIFETMVFGGDRDGETRRYPSEAAALVGHDELVKEIF